MSYTRKDRNRGRESRRDTEGRLMEEEARYRPEEHVMRWSKQYTPLPEKDKERVGAK
jgi:hypothetical protein